MSCSRLDSSPSSWPISCVCSSDITTPNPCAEKDASFRVMHVPIYSNLGLCDDSLQSKLGRRESLERFTAITSHLTQLLARYIDGITRRHNYSHVLQNGIDKIWYFSKQLDWLWQYLSVSCAALSSPAHSLSHPLVCRAHLWAFCNSNKPCRQHTVTNRNTWHLCVNHTFSWSSSSVLERW